MKRFTPFSSALPRLLLGGLFTGAALTGATLLGGCARDESGSPAGRNPLRGMAAAYLAANAFDSTALALRRGDTDTLQRRASDLELASEAIPHDEALRLALAAASITSAVRAESLVSSAPDGLRRMVENEPPARYRAALSFLPEDPAPLGPELLNALGYFLADEGSSRADFERAVELTRLALEQSQAQAELLPAGSPERVLADWNRAVGPQDSYAWALFRAGQFEAARQQQEEVLLTVRALRGMGPRLSPEIPFHMAEIYRALNQKTEARRAYQLALRLDPDAALRAKIEAGLQK